ncbi:2'-5' RNA ligase family protein [Cellulomonas endophytica]|uniref:2'-5' RNA ligase family protein n=1 Tax=Cellulomonas endophytica TaxID=2494735 RepID=UPI001F0BF869|nr:2'-5' RNA ligase family protein [Cellulomonas endophytica]
MAPRLQALELLPDAAGQARVRADWDALAAAGLPSQAQHRGATNAPHVTLLPAPVLDAALLDRARDGLAPLLPVRVRAAGLVVLGGPRVTLARLVDAPDALVAAVLALRAAAPATPHPGWLAHVTLARRLDRADVGRAVELLGHEDVELDLVALRHWDPAGADGAGATTTLVGPDGLSAASPPPAAP